ncbi:carbohydrate-binding domain-containing protein [Odoribacter sp. OttesenSCG-928-L07]|nr:carbohydrate-binding domain-containing protein [Odoribacter sp. OttesenSCG-928-L07]
MRKNILFAIIFSFVGIYLYSQEYILIHNNNNIIFETNISNIDNIKFQNSTSILNLNSGGPVNIPMFSIDSITFSDEIINPGETIYIIYNNNDVTIINPFENQGISIENNNNHVIANATSGIANIEYNVSGFTDNGSLIINSDASIIMTLNGTEITNPSGAVINVTADNVRIQLRGNSILTTGSSSTANGTLICSNSIEFTGEGSLSITAEKKHGIYTSGSINVETGTIKILQSASDGFHSNGFTMNNGTVDVIAGSDGIDAGTGSIMITGGNIFVTSTPNDVKGIKSDSNITISGGEISMQVSGAQSKGISSKQNITFSGGTIHIITSGATVLEESGNGYDPSYCTAIKADGNIEVTDANITVEALETCNGGKGFSADGSIIINSGTINVSTTGDGAVYTDETGSLDSFACTCITADVDINILGGTITCLSSGLGGKGISADGALNIGIINANDEDLILTVTTTGERFLRFRLW